MAAKAFGQDELLTHADILDQRDMGGTVVSAGAAFDAAADVSGQSCRPIAAFDGLEKLGRL